MKNELRKEIRKEISELKNKHEKHPHSHSLSFNAKVALMRYNSFIETQNISITTVDVIGPELYVSFFNKKNGNTSTVLISKFIDSLFTVENLRKYTLNQIINGDN